MRLLLALVLLVAAPVGAQQWTPTASLPDGYNGHALVASEGFLYNLGGLSSTNGALDAQNVFAAAVQPDGSLSAWKSATPLPVGVFYHAGVAARGFVYVLGGYHYDSASGLGVSDGVLYAKQNADGTLSAWNAASSLPKTLFFLSAAYWNGAIYVSGGWDGQQLSNAVYSAVVRADGSLGPWTAQRSLPDAVYTHAEVSDGTLYVLGGAVDGGSEIQNAVWAAAINPDGTLASWSSQSPLPVPLSNHGAAVSSGRVYVLGGWDGTQQRAEVYSAASGQALGAWGAEPALPRALSMHGVAVWNGRLYVSGGNDPVATQAGVYWRALPAAPPPADQLPPRTTLALGQPSAGAYIAPATPLTLSAVDDLKTPGDSAGLGVAATIWSVDDSSPAAYAGPFAVAAEGAHWLRYYSVDTTGNAEAVHLASAAVDATAPVSTLSIGAPQASLAGGSLLVSSSTLLSAQAADPLSGGVASGVSALALSVDGAPVDASAPFALPAADGPHVIRLQAVDAVGNAEAAHSQTVFVHLTPPVTTLAPTIPAYVPADGSAPFVGASGALAFSAQDPAAAGVSAGVRRTEFSLDGAPVAAATGTLVLAEGAHTIAYRSVDNVGNAEGWKTASWRVDAAAPQTTFTIGSPVMMLSGAPVVTPDTLLSLSAADPASGGVASGVKTTVYSLDGGADQDYTGPLKLPAGAHALSYGSVDNAGNVEPRRSVTLTVQAGDTRPPRTTLSWLGAAPAEGFVAASSALRLSAVDDLSSAGDGLGAGVAAIDWSLDAAPFSVYAGTVSLPEGAHWLRYYAWDAAGNAEAVHVASVSVDGTPPVSSLSAGAPQAALSTGELIVSSSTLLSVQAADPASAGVASGVAALAVTVDGRAVDAASPFALPAADGAHALSLRAVDAVGNAEAAHAVTVYVDATAPVTSVAPSVAAAAPRDGGSPWLGAAASLSFAAQDPQAGGIASGVGRTEYALDGAPASPASAALVLAEGAHTVAYRSVDNVGNAELWKTASYRVDATAPLTTLALGSPVLSLFGRQLVTTQTPLSLSAADPASGGVASGVKTIVYSLDGGADQAYAGAFTLPAGAHTLRYGAVDNAGNAEPRQTAEVAVGTFLSDAAAAAEAVTLSGGASVNGDVRAPQVALNGRSTIAGQTVRQAPVEAVDIAAARAYAQSANDDAAVPAQYLSNGALSLSGQQSLTLPAGVYYFTGLSIVGQASLAVSGPAQVFVAGPVEISGQGALNAEGDAGSLYLFSDGASVSLSGQGRAALDLYAPAAAAAFSGGGQVAGRLYARTLSLGGSAVLPSTTALPPSSLSPGQARKLERPEAEGRSSATAASVGGSSRALASVRAEAAAPPPPSIGAGSRSDGPSQRREDLPAAAALARVSQSSQTYAAAAFHGARPAVQPAAPALAALSGAPVAVAAAFPERAAPAAPSLGAAAAPRWSAAPQGPLGRPVSRRRARLAAAPVVPLAPRAAASLVDAQGSAVRAKSGEGVVVPAGAVTSGLNVTVSAAAPADSAVERRQDQARDALGIVPAGEPVQFGPEGTHFAKAVTIELPFDRSLVASGVPLSALVVHYWNPKTSAWEPLPSAADASAGVVRAQTSHFSLYQVHAATTAATSLGSSAASGPLAFQQVYAYPNPARHGARPVVHVEVTGADRVQVSVYDLGGALLQQGTLAAAGGAAEYALDTGSLGSGVYLYVVKASAEGRGAIRRSGRLAVIK